MKGSRGRGGERWVLGFFWVSATAADAICVVGRRGQ